MRETRTASRLEDWIYGQPPGKITFVTFAGSKVVKVKEMYAGLGGSVAEPLPAAVGLPPDSDFPVRNYPTPPPAFGMMDLNPLFEKENIWNGNQSRQSMASAASAATCSAPRLNNPEVSNSSRPTI